MSFNKWFDKQSRLIQLILLLIPIVNWVVEILVRLSALLTNASGKNILGVICAIFIPVWGWVDLVCVLLFNHLAFCE